MFILDDGELPFFTDVGCVSDHNLCLQVDYADGSSELLLLDEELEAPTILKGYLESDPDIRAVVILADEYSPDDTVRFITINF